MTEGWKGKIPVVTLRRSFGDDAPHVYTGYGCQTDNAGVLLIYEMEPTVVVGRDTGKRREMGHSLGFANGTWELVEMEWQAIE